MSYKKLAIFLSLMMAHEVALANFPVIDIGAIAQTYKVFLEAKKQYDELKALAAQNKRQYDLFKNNINGMFGYGDLFNDLASLRHRQWSNNNWTDVLREASNAYDSAFNSAQRKYDELYQVKRATEIFTTQREDNLSRVHYEQSRQISRSALAASAYSYDQINQHIETIHTMIKKLDQKPSQKASVDLSARLIAEVGFIQLEMLRQQNIQNQLVATQSQRSVNDISEQAQFLSWHTS